MTERKDEPRKTAPAAKTEMPARPQAPRTVFSATPGGAASASRLQPARVGEDTPPRTAAVTPLKPRNAPAAKPAAKAPAKAKAKSKPKAKAKAPKRAARAGAPVWDAAPGGAALADGYRKLSEAASESWRAASEAGERLMKNAEKVGRELTDFAEKEAEAQAAAVREFSKCRSIEALVAAQSGHAKERLGRLAAHTEKMQRLSLALARESFAPLEAEIDKAASRFIRTLTP